MEENETGPAQKEPAIRTMKSDVAEFLKKTKPSLVSLLVKQTQADKARLTGQGGYAGEESGGHWLMKLALVLVGMALAAKLDGKKWRTYAVLSDGEHDEGQTWEAIMFAGKNELHNLIAVIDRNNIQIDGFTEDVMPLEPLAEKYRSFNWHVLEIDGHNFEDIVAAFRHAKAVFEKPTVIIAHTIPGKGVDFMENDYHWHGKVPKSDEAKLALKELRTLRGKIVSEHE